MSRFSVRRGDRRGVVDDLLCCKEASVYSIREQQLTDTKSVPPNKPHLMIRVT